MKPLSYLAIGVLAVACRQNHPAEGPLERAGKHLDHAAAKTGTALEGAAVKTGDAATRAARATGRAVEKVGNKLQGKGTPQHTEPPARDP